MQLRLCHRHWVSGLVAAWFIAGPSLATAQESNPGSYHAIAMLWKPLGIVALLGATAFVLLRYLRGRGARIAFPFADEQLEVLSTTRVAGRWQLALVRAQGRVLLVGGGAQGVQLLADVTAPASAAEDTPKSAAPAKAPAVADPLDALELPDAEPPAGSHRMRSHRVSLATPSAGGLAANTSAERAADAEPPGQRVAPRLVPVEAGQRAGGVEEAVNELALIRQRLLRYRGNQE